MQIKSKVTSFLCVGLLACSMHIKADLASMKDAFETINDMFCRDQDVCAYATIVYSEMYNVLGTARSTVVLMGELDMTKKDGGYYVILANVWMGIRDEKQKDFYDEFLTNFTIYQQMKEPFYESGDEVSEKGVRIANHTSGLKILAQLLSTEPDDGANTSALRAYFRENPSSISEQYHAFNKENITIASGILF